MMAGREETTGGDEPAEKGCAPAKRICGLVSRTFCILVAVVVLLICIAVGVGAGVGVTQAKPSSTTPETPSPTSTAFVTSCTTGTAANSCDAVKMESHLALDDTLFQPRCFTDFPGGEPAAGDEDAKFKDVGTALAYTFEDCMDECVRHNNDLGDDEIKCRATSYIPDLSYALGEQGLEGNCIFKDREGKGSSAKGEDVASAFIT